MKRIHFGIAFLLLSSKTLGQYNYPTPATSFNGRPTQQHSSPEGFLQPAPTAPTVFPSSDASSINSFQRPESSSSTSFSNGYLNQGGPFQQSSDQAGEYPQKTQSILPSDQPSGSGYSPAGTPRGPPFPQQPNAGPLGRFPAISGSTANFPINGQKLEQSFTTPVRNLSGKKTSNSNFPAQGVSATYPSSPAREQQGAFGNQGITSSSYPEQGLATGGPDQSSSSYPQNAAPSGFGNQNDRSKKPESGFEAGAVETKPGQVSGTDIAQHGSVGLSAADESDYSAIPGEPDIDYPILSLAPQTSFRCDQQQYPGYYADIETRCQLFHVCANNITYDFLCPNGTIFHQQFFVCVWWNQFDCDSAPSFYEMNANINDYSISAAQQQTGAIPAGPDVGENTAEESEGNQISSGTIGTEGFQSIGYQPTGPGSSHQLSAIPDQAISYPSRSHHVSDGNSGYPAGGPSRLQDPQSLDFSEKRPQPSQAPQRPSTSPQVPNYPSSGYSNSRPKSPSFQPNFERPSHSPGLYPGSSKPTPGYEYLPPVRPENPLQPDAYSGLQNPVEKNVNRGQSSNGFSGTPKLNGHESFGSQQAIHEPPGNQQLNGRYPSKNQATGGYSSSKSQNRDNYGKIQSSDGNTKSPQSSGEFSSGDSSLVGYVENQQPTGGYPAVQQPPTRSYSNRQNSNGGYPNAHIPGGSPPRQYLPPVRI